MVTKLAYPTLFSMWRSVLAKIHMVTKLELVNQLRGLGSVLAKIHMVTKLLDQLFLTGFVLF